MSIVQYHPWARPRGVQEEIKQVFDRFLGDTDEQSNGANRHWMPRVDIREEAERFVILADIPGIDPKDIEIDMDKGILSLRGQRQPEQGEDAGRYSRVERAQGVFHRRFTLPDTANADGITATGKHGVLRIDIPKKPETTPRRIQVQ